MQYTSKEAASRTDVATLQGELDRRLLHRQAREAGICPVREELYRQSFGESRRRARQPGGSAPLLPSQTS